MFEVLIRLKRMIRLYWPFLVGFVALLGLFAVLSAFGEFARNNPAPVLTGMFRDGAIIGIAAMGSIQLIRYLFPIRGAFHRSRLVRWTKHSPLEQPVGRLLGGGDRALFDLPIEQLFGQVSAVLVQDLTHAYPLPADGGEEYLRARVAMEEVVRRELDRLQIRISQTWRRLLRAAALGISGGMAFAWQFGAGTPIWRNVLPMIFVTLIAGFVATVSRDVVAVVEKLRR